MNDLFCTRINLKNNKDVFRDTVEISLSKKTERGMRWKNVSLTYSTLKPKNIFQNTTISRVQRTLI